MTLASLAAIFATASLAGSTGDDPSPRAFVDSYIDQRASSAAFDRQRNPVLRALSGFDSVWRLGDDAWASGGADFEGATDFSRVEIVDPAIWSANMAYVLAAARGMSDDDAVRTYLDDRRHQNYSVIDGLGPLADAYRRDAHATTTVQDPSGRFDVREAITFQETDHGSGPGDTASRLGAVVALSELMRGPESTTEPAKHVFASPRPWRMTVEGNVVETGSDTVGDRTVEAYDSETEVLPSLLYVRSTRGRGRDGGYPSGHTNAAYLGAYALAYAYPERFAELLIRASELGESRIRSGMHSPVDVIGGRVMATALAAAYLNDPRHAEAKAEARSQALLWLAEHPLPAQSAADPWAATASNRDLYRFRLSYGLPRAETPAEDGFMAPKGSEVLLETRFPYLDARQRRALIESTALEPGHPLLDADEAWGRIDLVAATGGFATLDEDVRIVMTPETGPFGASDIWVNAISGPGRLIKSGSGTLALAGENSFTGGIEIEEGVLEARSPRALGGGSLTLTGGALKIGADAVQIPGDYRQAGGALMIRAGDGASRLEVSGEFFVEHGALVIIGDIPAEDCRVIVEAQAVSADFTDVLSTASASVQATADSLSVCAA
ncbi:phosphatase PAP2 family protein [Glycocaulis profundi]|nr:phosphatase PAP2 family protein [Glycocaulis profundi]